MPISNDIRVSPSGAGGGQSALIPEGIYAAEIADIVYIPGEKNQYGKPQLKLTFKLTEGNYRGVELRSWVSMVMNSGWDNGGESKGAPSNLYVIAKAVMGEEPDPNQDFYPNILMGGRLRVWVETRSTRKGDSYSRVVKYSPSIGNSRPSLSGTSDIRSDAQPVPGPFNEEEPPELTDEDKRGIDEDMRIEEERAREDHS